MVSAVSVCACSAPPRAALLGEPKNVPHDQYVTDNAEFDMFHDGLTSFSSKFTAATYDGNTYAVSPISVYLSLAVVSECADGGTEAQLLNALETDRAELKTNYPLLYGSLFSERKLNNKTIALTEPSNSIWIDTAVDYKESCIKTIADDFYCYSYSADFAKDNAAANSAIRKFVSDKTRGLIDKDFELSKQTLFAIINTLYLKDVWREFGEELGMTRDKYTFEGLTASVERNLLSGYYRTCRAYSGNGFEACYTTTEYGNRLLFMVPADGYELNDVLTAENINAAISHNYAAAAFDHEQKKIYNTNCLFPEFSASYDKDITNILASRFGITDLFGASCDLGKLTDESVICTKVRHVTKLDVNRKGIEGAAVTVVAADAASPGRMDDYEEVYETFTVDKAFGFAILDRNGTVLFSGAVTDL